MDIKLAYTSKNSYDWLSSHTQQTFKMGMGMAGGVGAVGYVLVEGRGRDRTCIHTKLII